MINGKRFKAKDKVKRITPNINTSRYGFVGDICTVVKYTKEGLVLQEHPATRLTPQNPDHFILIRGKK